MTQQLSFFEGLARHEGVDTEYKTACGGLPKDVWKTCSAFANTDRGTYHMLPSGQWNESVTEGPVTETRGGDSYSLHIGDRSLTFNSRSPLWVARFGTEVAGLLKRNSEVLLTHYLTPEMRSQQLQLRYPDKSNHSQQQYTTVEGATE